MNWRRGIGWLGAALVAVTGITVVGAPAASAAVASGCSASRPTSIGGAFTAYGGRFEGWTVDAVVGMDFLNSAGQRVNIDGGAPGAGYSIMTYLNRGMAEPGKATDGRRHWGDPNVDRPLCISSKITTVYLEVYPHNSKDQTSKIYFGGSSDQNRKIRVGQTNTYDLRLPTNYQYGGNTGNINGYVSYKGRPISASNLVFRAWSHDAGTVCGVQGFSASAEQIHTSGDGKSTYYVIPNLAGGQCGQSSQLYREIVTCKNVCGASSVAKTVWVSVSKGKQPRQDIHF